MANRNDLGIYQMDNGRWGYRITQEVNGKLKDVRRVRDENGNPFMTKKSAIIAKQRALAKIENNVSSKRKRKTLARSPIFLIKSRNIGLFMSIFNLMKCAKMDDFDALFNFPNKI